MNRNLGVVLALVAMTCPTAVGFADWSAPCCEPVSCGCVTEVAAAVAAPADETCGCCTESTASGVDSQPQEASADDDNKPQAPATEPTPPAVAPEPSPSPETVEEPTAPAEAIPIPGPATEEPTPPTPGPASENSDVESAFPEPAPPATNETPETPPAEEPVVDPFEAKPAAEPGVNELFPPTSVLAEPGGWASFDSRQWRDADGAPLATARLAAASADGVRLVTDQGNSKGYSYRLLSTADLEFLKQQVQAQRAELAASGQAERLARQER